MAGAHGTSRGGLVSAGDGAAGEGITLCEALDRLLHKGAVLKGEVTISVAGVELVYLGLHVLLASVETVRRQGEATGSAA
ncbi:gas vesicle protein [Leptolyngbya sp. 7M]|uniref:gas vesicle protein n=1 Tax=Leptolyngbya sp. 7M TaxID=2812896 RepID=UPI001B8CA256|nr:gas vesicle protein [Leptolyngbya sp. 7M]QYO64812.1 gas vesicle protein [Leptolyngbya sp. 7M]